MPAPHGDATAMKAEGGRVQVLGRWFTWVRLLAVPLAVAQVVTETFPAGYRRWAWLACAALALGALTLAVLERRTEGRARRDRLAVFALAFDVAIVSAFILLFSFEPGQPIRSGLFLVVLAAAMRFGLRGGILAPLALGPLLFAAEAWRAWRFSFSFETEAVLLRFVLALLIGVVVGQLVEALIVEERRARTRAAEAERLRDELSRRADLQEAATRCARALSSSLELRPAFDAFTIELRAFVPFDRMGVVLREGDDARVMAVTGLGADTVYPPESRGPTSLLEEAERGGVVVHGDMREDPRPEEGLLIGLGLRCRASVPLLAGPEPIGMLSLTRLQPHSFDDEELELLALLGRLAGSAVQNIRAYGAERRTAEEMRNLAVLRADFVSLVSHELRSPMAAVIGAARTLESRWRDLSQGQRDAFLALIVDETDRLAKLVGDVLETSKIEAGTFGYTFTEVDLAALVRDSVRSAETGQAAVPVRAEVREPLPSLRADPARLRQVLGNLIENAVKYTPPGQEVRVSAAAANGSVRIDVRDRGSGIAPEHQSLIFEKFRRVDPANTVKTGSGLGLFIARSIAEAHGGSLEVRSQLAEGSTFTLLLPLDPPASESGASGG